MADLIDRQAAIDDIRTMNPKDAQLDIKWVEMWLKQLPPAQPQRTGHWIPVGVAEVVGGESAQWGSAIAYHKCSECDEQALRDDFEQEVLSKWCPHCGANMVGVSE